MISKDYGLAYSQIFNLNWKTKNLPIILNNNSWKQCFKLLKTLSREIYYLIKAFDSVNLFKLALSLPNQRTCQRSSLKYPNGNCWLNLHYRLCLSFVSVPLKYFKSNLLISFFLNHLLKLVWGLEPIPALSERWTTLESSPKLAH